MQSNKPRVAKDYDKLDTAIQEQIKLAYPSGFSRKLIKYKNKEGRFISALPFESDEKYYLVRMTVVEAQEIIENDDDYDEYGKLTIDAKNEYEDKHIDVNDLADELADSSNEDDD